MIGEIELSGRKCGGVGYQFRQPESSDAVKLVFPYSHCLGAAIAAGELLMVVTVVDDYHSPSCDEGDEKISCSGRSPT